MSYVPTWQENLARIRTELLPGYQDVLDIAIEKIERQMETYRAETQQANDAYAALREAWKETQCKP